MWPRAAACAQRCQDRSVHYPARAPHSQRLFLVRLFNGAVVRVWLDAQRVIQPRAPARVAVRGRRACAWAGGPTCQVDVLRVPAARKLLCWFSVAEARGRRAGQVGQLSGRQGERSGQPVLLPATHRAARGTTVRPSAKLEVPMAARATCRVLRAMRASTTERDRVRCALRCSGRSSALRCNRASAPTAPRALCRLINHLTADAISATANRSTTHPATPSLPDLLRSMLLCDQPITTKHTQ